MMSQDRNTASSTFYILAAHGGAGFHPPTFDSSLKCSLRDAVSSALTVFSDSDATPASGNASESSALDAATALIATLEDAPDFNAGYGSNLTFDGDVECDASLMSTEEEEEIISHSTGSPDHTRSSSSSSSYSFGSVGAVRGVRNPVLLARRVLEGRRRGRGRRQQQQQQQPESGEREEVTMAMTMTMMGRVPPLMLVGEGASQFAKEQGLRTVERSNSEEMVSPRARSEWRVWRERWDRCCRRSAAEEEEEQPARVSDAGSDLDPDLRLRGEGRHEDEEVSVLLAPRVGCGSDGGADGGHGYGETLRARQDTVGAVVLVGGAADDVHRQQVAAGVSRCVPVVCYQSISSLAVQPHYNIIFTNPAPKTFSYLLGPDGSFTAVVCCSSTLDALVRSVGPCSTFVSHTHIYIPATPLLVRGCM